MSSSYERYILRMTTINAGIVEERKKQAKQQIIAAFETADGYQLGECLVRDGGWGKHDFLLKHTLTGQEKKVVLRPDKDLPIGTYLKYTVGDREETVILRERILDDSLMPSYKAYICQDTLRIKGFPIEGFPCYGFNSSYSSKGMIDNDVIYTLDSRNKIYVQKNEYTVKLFEKHRGYRIILGDEETKYNYFITEMDDISYPGMFIISLKIDEKHPNDDGFYAYNEEEIEFNSVVGQTELKIDSTKVYCRTGETVLLTSNKPVEWEYEEKYEIDIPTGEQIPTIVIPLPTDVTELEKVCGDNYYQLTIQNKKEVDKIFDKLQSLVQEPNKIINKITIVITAKDKEDTTKQVQKEIIVKRR